MRITIERTQYEPVYVKGVIQRWNIGWSIETDTGQQLYTPTSVERRMVSRPTEARVTAYSLKEVLPGQIIHLMKDFDVVDELDDLERQIAEEDQLLQEEQEHAIKLKQEREDRLNEARERLEAKKQERITLMQKQQTEKAERRAQGLPTFGGSTNNGNSADDNNRPKN